MIKEVDAAEVDVNTLLDGVEVTVAAEKEATAGVMSVGRTVTRGGTHKYFTR